jgi:hypothetical protein
VLTLCVSFLSQPTQAQQEEDDLQGQSKRGDRNYRAAFIRRIQKYYANIVAPIERVRPSEAKFLHEEIKETIRSDTKLLFYVS